MITPKVKTALTFYLFVVVFFLSVNETGQSEDNCPMEMDTKQPLNLMDR